MVSQMSGIRFENEAAPQCWVIDECLDVPPEKATESDFLAASYQQLPNIPELPWNILVVYAFLLAAFASLIVAMVGTYVEEYLLERRIADPERTVFINEAQDEVEVAEAEADDGRPEAVHQQDMIHFDDADNDGLNINSNIFMETAGHPQDDINLIVNQQRVKLEEKPEEKEAKEKVEEDPKAEIELMEDALNESVA